MVTTEDEAFVGLSRITDKLIPSIDWKKSFSRSSTQAWGSRDRLSQAVKIRTSRLYFLPAARSFSNGGSGWRYHPRPCDRIVGLVVLTGTAFGAACCSQE